MNSIPVMPTRVLNVEDAISQHKVRLAQTDELFEHWVALSYCWGHRSSSQLTTTKARLSEFTSSIPISSLPKTVKEAIIVTRTIGLRYLCE